MRNSILCVIVLIGLCAPFACNNSSDTNPTPANQELATVQTGTTTSELTDSSFVLSSNVLTLGEPVLSAAGLVYSTSANPKLGDAGAKAMPTSSLAVGAFSSRIVGLNASTTYFARAYATNTDGIGYSAAVRPL